VKRRQGRPELPRPGHRPHIPIAMIHSVSRTMTSSRPTPGVVTEPVMLEGGRCAAVPRSTRFRDRGVFMPKHAGAQSIRDIRQRIGQPLIAISPVSFRPCAAVLPPELGGSGDPQALIAAIYYDAVRGIGVQRDAVQRNASPSGHLIFYGLNRSYALEVISCRSHRSHILVIDDDPQIRAS